MLAIRMQRTGRKGYASFRVIVQDSRFAPTSGRVVANLGHHNPHTKETAIDTEAIERYLSNGAQPSPRVVKLLKEQKVTLPDWVAKPDTSQKKKTKNPEKLRKNQPAEPAAEEATADEPVPAEAEDTPKADAVEEATEPVAEDAAKEAHAEEVAEKTEEKPEEKTEAAA